MRTYIDLIEHALHRAPTRASTSLSTKAELEAYFGNEANYPNHVEYDDGTMSSEETNNQPREADGRGGQHFMASHGPAVFCDSWARFVVDCLPGRAKKVGFDMNGGQENDNDESALSRLCDGHAFAIVDERYIVDGWLKNVEAESSRAVFDMQDASDAQAIKHFYGNPATWEEGQ